MHPIPLLHSNIIYNIITKLLCSQLFISSLLAFGGLGSQGKTPPHSPSYSCSPNPISRPNEFSGSNCGNYGQSVPIPVPTQVQNYHRMEQNLHSPSQDGSPRLSTPVRRCSSNSSLGFGRTGPSPPYPGGHGALAGLRRLSVGGARPFQLSPQGLLECTDVSENVSLLSLLLFFFFLSPPLSHLPLCLKWVPSLSCQGRRTRWAQTQVAEGRRAELSSSSTRGLPLSSKAWSPGFTAPHVSSRLLAEAAGKRSGSSTRTQWWPITRQAW